MGGGFIAATLVIGIFWDVLAMVVLRVLVRQQSKSANLFKVVGIAIIEIVLAFSVLFGTLALGIIILGSESLGYLGFIIMLSSYTNLFAALLSFVFSVAALSLLIHRLAWPLVARPLYRLARIGIFKTAASRSALFAVGVAALGVATGKSSHIFSFIIRLLTAT